MNARFRLHSIAILALSASLAAAGCKKSTPVAPSQPTLNSDGSTSNPNGTVTVPPNTPAAASTPAQAPPQQYAVRNPDGSITNPDGSVTYPPGSRVADKENAPNGSAPSTASSQGTSQAPAPPPVSHTVAAGAAVVVRTTETLSAHNNQVGDRWSGVLERPLISHGDTIFAAGTPVSGTVVASKGKGRFKGAGDLGIELAAIGHDHVSASEYEKVAKGRGKRSAAFTGGGGGLGALIGGLAGGGKGALIGGLAGAGGGAAAGSYTGSTDVVIPAESVITFRLTESLTR